MNTLIKNNRKELGMFVLLLVLCVLTYYGSGGRFLNPINITNLFRQIGMYGIFSIGLVNNHFLNSFLLLLEVITLVNR